MTADKPEPPAENDNKTLETVNEKLKLAYEEIQQKNAELEEAYKKLDELARTDILTGLSNRRELEEHLVEEVRRSQRMQNEFSVCIGDIDDFKNINDAYGHDVGDQVLKDIGRIFRENTRGTDMVGRWGGEEFMFILPETPGEGAMVLMEKVRMYVMEHVVRKGTVELKVTVTLGFSTFQPGSSVEKVVKQADLALYAGKKSGKNLAIEYDPNLESIHSLKI